jgi:hypothetical protein
METDGDVRRGCRQIASAAELGFSGWTTRPFAVLRGKIAGRDQPVSLQRLKEAIPRRDVCIRWRSCLQLLFRAKVPANISGVIFPLNFEEQSELQQL